MCELHDEIMAEVGKAIHDLYDKKYPDSRGGYGDNIEAGELEDEISGKIKDLCETAEGDLRQAQGEFESADESCGELEEKIEGLEEDIEEIELDTEWDKMQKSFAHYAGHVQVV